MRSVRDGNTIRVKGPPEYSVISGGEAIVATLRILLTCLRRSGIDIPQTPIEKPGGGSSGQYP
jgi:hypothetical protein